MLKLQRNGRFWQASGRIHGQKIRRGCGSMAKYTRAAAQRRVDEMNAALLGGTAALDRSPSLLRWFERYEQRRESKVAESTLAIHRRTMSLLTEYFDPVMRVDQITRSMAADWRLWLESQMAESTVCKHVSAAKVIIDFAKDEDVVGINAFDRLRSTAPRIDPATRRLIDPEEYAAIRKWCSPRLRLLVDVLWYSGLRKFEAFELRVGDIAWGRSRFYVVNRSARITTKRESRTVRLEPELEAILAAAGEGKSESELIIDPRQRNCALKDLKAAAKKAGVDVAGISLKAFRVTRDTIWHNGPHRAYEIAEWMGHSEATAMKHYLVVTEEAYTRAARDPHGSGTLPADTREPFRFPGEHITPTRFKESREFGRKK